jgi:hypothetical protein
MRIYGTSFVLVEKMQNFTDVSLKKTKCFNDVRFSSVVNKIDNSEHKNKLIKYGVFFAGIIKYGVI